MITDPIAHVVCFVFNTLYSLVVLLLLIGLFTLIILLLPIVYAENKGSELVEKCVESVRKAHRRWRNRPRVRTGPMPAIGHPYR